MMNQEFIGFNSMDKKVFGSRPCSHTGPYFARHGSVVVSSSGNDLLYNLNILR